MGHLIPGTSCSAESGHGEQPGVRGQRAHEGPCLRLRRRHLLPPAAGLPAQMHLALAKAEILCVQMQHNDGTNKQQQLQQQQMDVQGYGNMFIQNGTLNSTAAFEQQLRFRGEHINDDDARGMPQERVIVGMNYMYLIN
jgi:hypothetical protein